MKLMILINSNVVNMYLCFLILNHYYKMGHYNVFTTHVFFYKQLDFNLVQPQLLRLVFNFSLKVAFTK